MNNNNKPDFSEIFPVGSRVRCESEMWEKRPDEYGTVAEHLCNRYGGFNPKRAPQAI